VTLYGYTREPEPPAEEPREEAATKPPARHADDGGAAALGWGHRLSPTFSWRRGTFVVAAAALAVVLAVSLAVVIGGSLGGGSADPRVAWRASGAAAASPSAAAAANDRVTLSGVGDVIMGTAPGGLPPRGGRGFFDPVKEALAADLVMGNLETPLTEDSGWVKCGGGVAGCHQFYLPRSYANHLRDGGFHLMSLANNHTQDMGPQGLRNTRAALDAVGISHTGAPNQITNVDVKGVRVAVLGFAIYSWSQNLNDIPAAQTMVRKAASAADIVVIQMQGGAEGANQSHQRPGHEYFYDEDRGDLMKFSRAVIDAGADVIFGHGPHVMRGMEFYKGRLIAYSLGNFCGFGVLSSAGFLGVGGVLKVALRRDGSWSSGRLIATEMVRGGLVAPDPDKRALSFVNRLSREDFGPTAARISRDGTITPPPAS
jgi:hypothetical protein